MLEILPIRLLRDEDAQIFGSLNVALGKLYRLGFPVTRGIVVTAPNLKLKTTLEHFDFGHKEVFEQSLSLVKKELAQIEIPEVLVKEFHNQKKFCVEGLEIHSHKGLWLALLNIWIEEIKNRLWKDGFIAGLTEGLSVVVVAFVDGIKGYGGIGLTGDLSETVIDIKSGKLEPSELKKIDELIVQANKKLLIPHNFEWILDHSVKLTKVLPFTSSAVILGSATTPESRSWTSQDDKNRQASMTIKGEYDKEQKSAVKVFLDLSKSLSPQRGMDGVYIASEKIFDLNVPKDSFEELLYKIVESSLAFPDNPILMKLADFPEARGGVRGALRLIHQKNLLEPLCEAVRFARDKKGLHNIHLVIPFVRGVSELLDIKRELAVRKLIRKNNLQIWMEVATPENIVNLDEYLIAGLDGVVLNLDELVGNFNGFDGKAQEVSFYKHEVTGLIKFLEDSLKLLHKSKVPFLVFGDLSLNPKMLDFLVEKGVHGIIVEGYEAPSMRELLHLSEKRMFLRMNS